MGTINFVAGGNISPSTFVKPSTAADNTALQAAAATDFIIGVSTPSARDPQISGASAVAAGAGDPINIFGIGEVCQLLAGSGGFTRGDQLTSDANGAGVPASSTNIIGAVALESTAYQSYGRVVVYTGKK
jgi:hypothetical protein